MAEIVGFQRKAGKGQIGGKYKLDLTGRTTIKTISMIFSGECLLHSEILL